jgi:hypothetical protein
MNIIIFYVLILLAAFPAGYILAYLARDELLVGRKWFLLLAFLSLLSAVALSFSSLDFKPLMILSLIFIVLISLMAVWKSYDKKWIKRK